MSLLDAQNSIVAAVDDVELTVMKADAVRVLQCDRRLALAMAEHRGYRFAAWVELANGVIDVVGNVDVVLVVHTKVLGSVKLRVQRRPIVESLLAVAGDRVDLAAGLDHS